MNFNIGGIGAALSGVQEGADAQAGREQLATQRAAANTEEQYRLAALSRAEQLRQDNAAVPQTTTTTVDQNAALNMPASDDDGNPMPAATTTTTAPVPQDVQLRQVAHNYAKQGDFDTAIKLQQQADAIGWDRSTQMFQQLASTSSGKSAPELAQSAAEIFNQDPFGGQVTNITPTDGGGVSITAKNRQTGQSSTRTYANSSDLMNGLQAYYSPQTYAALQKARLEAITKAQEEQAKPQVIPAGGAQTYKDVASGQQVTTRNDSGMVWTGQMNPDGTPQMVKGMARGTIGADGSLVDPAAGRGGAGAGAGAGRGKGNLAPADAAVAAVDEFAKGKNTTLDDKTWPVARTNAAALVANNPGMPPELASQLAVKAATDPTAPPVPVINQSTGMIDKAIKGDNGQSFTLQRGVGSPSNPAGLKPEQLTQLTGDFLGGLTPDMRAKYLKAAQDPQAAEALKAQIQQTAEQAITSQSQGASPQQVQAAQQRLGAYVKQRSDALQNLLSYVKAYTPKQTLDAANAPPPSAVPADLNAQARLRVGGIAAAVAKNPLNPQVTPDAADTAAMQARATARDASSAAAAGARAQRQKAAAALNLTPQQIQAMRPSEAKSILDQYSDVLDPTIERQLRRQL